MKYYIQKVLHSVLYSNRSTFHFNTSKLRNALNPYETCESISQFLRIELNQICVNYVSKINDITVFLFCVADVKIEPCNIWISKTILGLKNVIIYVLNVSEENNLPLKGEAYRCKLNQNVGDILFFQV